MEEIFCTSCKEVLIFRELSKTVALTSVVTHGNRSLLNGANAIRIVMLVHSYRLLSNLIGHLQGLNHVGTERRDATYRIPALRGGIPHVMSCCYVLNQLGNATSDPSAFKIPQVPSSILAALGLYSQSSVFLMQ